MGPVEVARQVFGTRPIHVAEFDPVEAEYGEPSFEIHRALSEGLSATGVTRLYKHQALAFDTARSGKDLIVVTGTSSGKSLCYNLPVLDSCLREPKARALYLFPTKALAQDQAGKLSELLPPGLFCATYDGDTSSATRSAVRKSAHVVMTNPDMLHVGILPNHESWTKFLSSLRYVVIDEAHTYRGVFGSHVGGVLRRLFRLCAWHKNRPQVIACSATIANPAELFERLTGRVAEVIDQDSAPRGRRVVVLVEPPEGVEDHSPNSDTAALLAEFVENCVRTLAFCRARVTTELVVRYARSFLEKRGLDQGWVDSYRGGYTARERREIEQALFKGRLRGLATTNAMELGVDVGGLDAVLMNGYPGSISSFWQQAGRAGRGTRPGLAVMLAHDDPLERFLVRRPSLLLDKPVESATLNPSNPQVLEAQLRCAAYERPVSEEELHAFGPNALSAADQLVDSGSAVWQAGRLYYPSHQSPARKVNIRGSDSETVLLTVDGKPLGEMEFWRALRQAHTGAVYLHRGQTYFVEELDLRRKLASLEPVETPYYTLPVVQSLVESTVLIEEDGPLSLNGVRVTTSIPGFTKWSMEGHSMLGEEPLDLPVQSFDTLGVRLDLPELTLDEASTVHALEHAVAAVAPLIAGCDRNDLGSCWFVMCPETMAPAVYVFDATPGGVGLAEALFKDRGILLQNALQLLDTCPCEDGCPACLLSARCESDNESLDKRGAMVFLDEELKALR